MSRKYPHASNSAVIAAWLRAHTGETWQVTVNAVGGVRAVNVATSYTMDATVGTYRASFEHSLRRVGVWIDESEADE